MIWGDREALAELVRALGEDPSIGRVVVFYDQPAGLTGAAEESWRAVREGIIAGATRSPVPTLVSSTLPELLDDTAAWEFARAGVAAAAGLRTGLRCAAEGSPAIADPGRLQRDRRARPDREPSRRRRVARRARGQGDAVGERDRRCPAGRVVVDEEDAVAAHDELGGPRGDEAELAGSVQHKSDLGGVALGLRSADEVRGAYRRLAALADAHDGSVLVERMAAPGAELMVAVRTDAIVPALVLALGGIWTELLDDVAIVPLPADAARIEVRAALAPRRAPAARRARR